MPFAQEEAQHDIHGHPPRRAQILNRTVKTARFFHAVCARGGTT
nr:MAG TPA: hypothetical protein [Caudoviricetes sp.]